MNLIAALAVAAAAFLAQPSGAIAPMSTGVVSESPAPAPVVASVDATASVHSELEADALESYDALNIPADHSAEPLVPSYVSSDAAGDVEAPMYCVRIESVNHPGIFHTFRYVRLERA